MIFQESELVELKEIVTDDIKKEIIAFANSDGGKLFIGIKDNGEILGVKDPDKTALQISNMIRDSIKPDVTMFIHYETITINEKQILKIDIQQGTERPYYIAQKGLRPAGVYVRQGFSSVPATSSAIRQMIKETDGDHYEDIRSLEQNLTFESAKKIFSRKNIKFEINQMKSLGLMSQDNIYTNLGLLLSDQCMHTIKIAVFQNNTQEEFKDRKEFIGSLFKQMEDAYDFIDFRNQMHSTFDKLYRIDKWDYPKEAIREALLNLIVHREYAFSASSLISMYEDRIEFISIGGLVKGISINDITMGISICRNAKLANIFYRLELIEAYGTGISKIMRSYQGSEFTPKIAVSDNAFKIILPNLNSNSNKKNTKKANINKEEIQDKIINIAKNKKEFTRKDIEKLLNLSQSSVGRILKKMIDNNQIVKEGKLKNTTYHLP